MILVFVLMLSTFTTVLAADRDLVHKETKEKKVFEEYLLDDSFIYELLVEGALEDYYVEVNEKLYNSAEVQEKFDEDPTVTLEEAVVGLDSVEEPTEELEVVKASAINANTISVTFDNEETVEIELEEALVHGENEVTFEYEGQTFTVTVNYEDPEVVEQEIAEAVDAAISAINEIGNPATLTLEDEAKVVAARTAVDDALELGAEETAIVNLDHLNAAETQINALKEALNEKETAIQEANVALTNLPLEVTLEDKEQVEEARELVNKALELGAEETDFVNLWKLKGAEATIAELEEAAAAAELAAAKETKIEEIEAVVLTEEETAGKTEESILLAEAKLQELKDAALAEVEAAETVEAVEAVEVDTAEALALLEDEVVALTVESVSAITNTKTIVVTLEEAVANAKFDVTFVDEDEEVTEIAVVSSEADEDNLVYTVVLEDLDGKKGTLVVNEVEYAFDYAESGVNAALSAVDSAANTIEVVIDGSGTPSAAQRKALLDALAEPVLNLVYVDEFFVDAYGVEIANSLTNTRVRLQAAIDRVNTLEADLIDAVNEALSVAALRDALTALGIKNVAAAPIFDVEYFDAIEANTTETKEQIQAVINAVNLEEVTALVLKAEKSEEQTDVTTALNTLNAVKAVDSNFDKPAEDETKGALEKRIDAVQTKVDIATAIAAVNAEIDATVTDADLLTALQNGDLDLDDVLPANKAAYADALEAIYADDNDFEFETVAQIQAFVDKVNADEEAGVITAAIAAVNAEVAATVTDANLLAALQNTDLDLDNVLPANEAAYADALEAIFADDNAFEFETVAEIQAFVDDVNLEVAIAAVDAEVGGTVTAANLLAALQDTVLDLDNVVARNTEVYASELEAIFEADATFAFETVAEIQAFVDAANATPVGKVNTAKNTTEMRAALENAELELDLAVYNELTSLEKNLVAQKLRADGTEFADAEGIQTELNAAVLDILGL